MKKQEIVIGKSKFIITTDVSACDETPCIWIDGPHHEEGCDKEGAPKVRVYLNDDTLFENPKLK